MEEGAGAEAGLGGPGRLLGLFAKKWNPRPAPDVQLHAAVSRHPAPRPAQGWGCQLCSDLAHAEPVKGKGH